MTSEPLKVVWPLFSIPKTRRSAHKQLGLLLIRPIFVDQAESKRTFNTRPSVAQALEQVDVTRANYELGSQFIKALIRLPYRRSQVYTSRPEEMRHPILRRWFAASHRRVAGLHVLLE